MAVNPFLIPLITSIHTFKSFGELAEFLVAAHFATGYSTGFGKLIDEKILPKVFGTIKLDKAARRNFPFSRSAFDEIDHIIVKNKRSPTKLLSLKAGRWTIQLTMAVQLNKSFNELLDLQSHHKLGDFAFDEIAVGVFYGTKETLTDKYDILRGINRGAKHDVIDLTKHVSVYSGREFWAWLNDGESATQEWVLDGILKGFAQAEIEMGSFSDSIKTFTKEFARQYQDCRLPDGAIDWKAIIRRING